MTEKDTAWLVLADGTAFQGRAFGARCERHGEVVFNTSMTGYPELLTDPSYRRQIVTLTYPEIGNYGVCPRDAESEGIQVSGMVVRSLSPVVSNWRSESDLSTWLAQANVPGISDIDTRALVRHIRDEGAMMGILSTMPDADPRALFEKAKALDGMSGCALTADVTCREPYAFTDGLSDDAGNAIPPLRSADYHVVAVDLGIKRNIARLLVHHGCRVTIVPAHTSAAQIMDLKPDGVFLSNGPGDPATATDVVTTVTELLGKTPIFGICMGHQILAQALGAQTYKTRFGHRGGNQPVLDPQGRVLITSQNHGFAVSPETLPETQSASHTNLSDGTNEGVRADGLWAFGVQYHPEAAPGPKDAEGHFGEFVDMMSRFER